MTSVEIPNSVKEIGERAFYCCYSLTSVEIPNTVKEIGQDAFIRRQSLTSVEIPDNVETIGEAAFDSRADDLTFYGAAGSVAEKYARENEIRFEAR